MRVAEELRAYESAGSLAEELPYWGWLDDGRTCLTRSGELIAAGRRRPAVVDGRTTEQIDRVLGRWQRLLSGLGSAPAAPGSGPGTASRAALDRRVGKQPPIVAPGSRIGKHPPRLPAGALVHSRCSQAQGPFGYSRTGRHRYERTWYTPRRQGYRGRNRVRVFPDPKTGIFQIEWRENGRRLSRSLKHRDWTRAKRQADEFAAGFAGPEIGGGAEAQPEPLTLETLFDIYGEEVTPTKGESSRLHNRAAMRMFLGFFARDRKPATLSQRDWDRFIRARRAGRVGPSGRPVSDRTVEADLKFLIAVFNWTAKSKDEQGHPLLGSNPLKGLKTPTEKNPTRVMLSEHLRWSGIDSEAGVCRDHLILRDFAVGFPLFDSRQMRFSCAPRGGLPEPSEAVPRPASGSIAGPSWRSSSRRVRRAP